LPSPVLSLLKYVFLAFLYLFFLRVLRAVWIELREPKTVEVVGPPSRRDDSARAMPPSYSPTSASALTTMSPAQPPAEYASGAGRPSPSGRLIVRAPPAMAGMTFLLADELTVGRSPGCGISLPDDTYVSSVHARVFRRADGYYLEDLGSTNGTFVFSERIGAPVHLRPGDQFQVGQTILELGP
jgi:pSer/pThr/pTyr-binding forkhead associated (FHA) protein